MLQGRLLELLPEIQFWDVGLPYLMVTYKIHKKKYRWLTNAANCIFLGPTIIITQTLHLIDMELKTWCSL